MAHARSVRRRRLIAPRVRSEQAATRLLDQMRAAGSEDVLPRGAWLTATRLPQVIAAENGHVR